MNTTPHSPESHADSSKPAGAKEKEDLKKNDNSTQGNPLDEALDESFPASDPVAISITSIEPGKTTPPAATGSPRQGR